MGSFILRGKVWISKQFQVSLLMIHILQDSISCIDGKHDNYSLSESMVVLFNKYICKSYVLNSVSSRFFLYPRPIP